MPSAVHWAGFPRWCGTRWPGRAASPSPARHRARRALTLTEREAISRGLARGISLRQISRQLRRAPSTVSREVRRHSGRRRYRATAADAAAWARGRRPKRCRLAQHPALRDAVATKLAHAWSPQQIAGWLHQAYPDDPTMHVSHETIYRSLFVQSRGVLKKALQAQLRLQHTVRRPRSAAKKSGGYIVGAVSIRERPATVEDRGLELAAHRTFSIATGVQVYFCDPYSPWQRGTNENTNGLLRQYLPKGPDLGGYTQTQLDAIARKLNTRPRKTLGYRTPADILGDTVASTG